MSLSELMDASKGVRGMTNMALAHEIAVDKNFELSKIQPENELEKQIKEVMQRAFWDILKEQLEQDPPVYSQALQLFMEVKTMLYSILLPQHEKLKRIIALRDRVERTAVSTAVILISFSQLSTFIIPMDSQAVKEKLKKHIDILLQDYYEDNDLLKILPSVAVQVVKEVNDYLTEKKKPALTEETVKSLTEQIESVEDPNQVCCLTSFFLFVHILYSPQRIRDLIQKRIIDFCKQLISNTNKTIPQVKSN